jgi:peptidylprolyl isomerase domain and WD repeat-containing protein 1
MEEESKNGGTTIPTEELAVVAVPPVVEEEEPMVGPGPAPRGKRKRPLQFEQAYLDSLPSANMYEKSYMHRDVVTHVAVSAAEFFISGSMDGNVSHLCDIYDFILVL